MGAYVGKTVQLARFVARKQHRFIQTVFKKGKGITSPVGGYYIDTTNNLPCICENFFFQSCKNLRGTIDISRNSFGLSNVRVYKKSRHSLKLNFPYDSEKVSRTHLRRAQQHCLEQGTSGKILECLMFRYKWSMKIRKVVFKKNCPTLWQVRVGQRIMFSLPISIGIRQQQPFFYSSLKPMQLPIP